MRQVSYQLSSRPAELEQADQVEDPEPHDDDRQMAATVGQLLEGLNASQTGESQVVSIDFTSTDPAKAARIANGVAELYVAGQRDEKLTAIRQAAAWLTDRVGHLRRLVLNSERAVEEYRAAHKMASSGEVPGQQELANLNLHLLTAQAQLAEEEARLLRVRDVHRRGAATARWPRSCRRPSSSICASGKRTCCGKKGNFPRNMAHSTQ